MKAALDIRREGILAGFIFLLWLMAVVFPLAQIDVYAPVEGLVPALYWLSVAYLLINTTAFVYALYMLVAVYMAGMRRRSRLQWLRIAVYAYAVIGLSVAIYASATQAFLH